MTTTTHVKYPGMIGEVSTFSLPFPYIDEDELVVDIEGEVLEASSFIVDGSSITIAPAPTGDVTIRRRTDVSAADVTFQNSGSIRPPDLNKAVTQLLYGLQEVQSVLEALGYSYDDNGCLLVDKSVVGLGNVENLAPEDLPVSVATAAAILEATNAVAVDLTELYAYVVINSTSEGGINASTLEGQDLSYVLDFGNLNNVPSYALASHNHAASHITLGQFADERISESSVSQHESALTIDYTQLTGTPDLASIISNGVPGPSAYQLAVTNGYSGSEVQWLSSLTGPAGAASTVPGPTGSKGDKGDPGDSGTQVDVDNNEELEFLGLSISQILGEPN